MVTNVTGGRRDSPAKKRSDGPGRAVLRLAPEGGERAWYELSGPRQVLVASTLDEVADVLRRVEEATESGREAAGFLAYEAAPAFDRALRVAAAGDLPLAWFALFDERRRITLPTPRGCWPLAEAEWRAGASRTRYELAFESIRSAIARGDTYQINYTFQLESSFDEDPWEAFLHLVARQRVPHAAFIDTGRWVICSASPELFFRRDGHRVTCRPMKGTAPRGRWMAEDELRGRELRQSAKNRAENLMIVDMVRNDLGRVATPGTVRVSSLFEVERFATLWQMTSTVTADTEVGLTALVAALFPCASITGAPKASSMGLITSLEASPRGVYTGAVGWLGPGRQGEMNVAIRTLVIDRQRHSACYGTGGGVVWDSSSREEYEECRTKSLVVRQPPKAFRLLETLAWRPGSGFALVARHLRRLAASAGYFGFELPRDLRARLRRFADSLPRRAHRVRLLLSRDGTVELEAEPLPSPARRPWRLAVAPTAVDEQDPFLFHKTTWRAAYERARRETAGFDDAVLVSSKGEVTETTIGNLVVVLDGRRVTPPIDSGLLAGTFRERLLERGEVVERSIRIDDLRRADAVWIVNSVRGWVRAEIDPHSLRRRGRPASAPGQASCPPTEATRPGLG